LIFQFSFWDSRLLELAASGARKILNFQFSFWDSCVGPDSCQHQADSNLSILFLRFREVEEHRGKRHSLLRFQFSFWDSGIPFAPPTARQQALITFNSLFEIRRAYTWIYLEDIVLLSILFLRFRERDLYEAYLSYIIFQFSFWDSPRHAHHLLK